MQDVSKILKDSLQEKEEELQRLSKEVEVLRSLVVMAEQPATSHAESDPASPFPPRRAEPEVRQPKQVKRYP